MALLTPDAPVDGFVYRRIRIPNDPTFIQAVGGALATLIFISSWTQHGSMTSEHAAALMKEMYLDWQRSHFNMIGTIQPYATSSPPDGMLACDGSVYQRTDYPALYDAIHSSFWIDADSFRVPDLRHRTIVGAGTLSGRPPRYMGEQGGAEAVTLTVDEMPEHGHTTQPHNHQINYGEIGHPTNNPDVVYTLSNTLFPAVYTTSETVIVNETGGSEPHDNMPPFTVLAFGIWAE